MYIDHSLRSSGGFIPATLNGHASDILSNATPRGKIVNGLDFPMWQDAQWERRSYATDMVAWDFLHGEPYCGTATTPYPTGHVRWGLAGTAHTVSMAHIDSDGFATFVQVMCGKKLWAVYRPSPGLPLWDTDVFVDPDLFQLDNVPEEAPFGLEAVVLRPGDLLYVTPFFPILQCLNCVQIDATWHTPLCLWSRERHHSWRPFLFLFPHANDSREPDTQLCAQRLHLKHVSPPFSSVIATHRHLLGAWVTRGEGDSTGSVNSYFESQTLNHFLDDEYFHLPDTRTVNGLVDWISCCTLAILANVLDFRTYCAPNQTEVEEKTKQQWALWKDCDRNDIPGDERMAMCYARGIALTAFQWIRRWCIVKTPDGEVIDDLPSKQVVQLLDALLVYKSKAEKRKLSGAPHCASWMLKVQALNAVQCDKAVERLWNKRKGKSSDSLRMTLDKGCTVEWRSDMLISSSLAAQGYLEMGMTPLDTKFFESDKRRSVTQDRNRNS
jgi:hypothetical protein